MNDSHYVACSFVGYFALINCNKVLSRNSGANDMLYIFPLVAGAIERAIQAMSSASIVALE
jgi:hypothetical protein